VVLTPATRAQVQSRGGRSSVLLSIHQPNGRLLELFDHILVLGQGGSVFFGTVDEATAYFRHRGLPVPPNQTPTDFFLQVCHNASQRSSTRSL
jgi:ABC-type multidrug transport system ATPase subunit